MLRPFWNALWQYHWLGTPRDRGCFQGLHRRPGGRHVYLSWGHVRDDVRIAFVQFLFKERFRVPACSCSHTIQACNLVSGVGFEPTVKARSLLRRSCLRSSFTTSYSIWNAQCNIVFRSPIYRNQPCNSHTVCIHSSPPRRRKARHLHRSSPRKRSGDSADGSILLLQSDLRIEFRLCGYRSNNNHWDITPKLRTW